MKALNSTFDWTTVSLTRLSEKMILLSSKIYDYQLYMNLRLHKRTKYEEVKLD